MAALKKAYSKMRWTVNFLVIHGGPKKLVRS